MLTGRFIKYVFPAATGTEVCQLQSTAGAGSLVLNGNLSNNINTEVSFIDNGYCRNLLLFSANDLSAVNFTINGTQNGVGISETLQGPNNAKVATENVFDIITSITVDGAADAVTIGSGPVGFFLAINIDQFLSPIGYNLAVNFGSADPVSNSPSYTVYGTLDNISLNGYIYSDLIAN